MYKININVGVEDDGQKMYRNTYLTKPRTTPISSKIYEDVVEDLDLMMANIYKRTRKWVEWNTTQRIRRKGPSAQSSLKVWTTSSSQSGASGTIFPTTQGTAQPVDGGDQPLDKTIPLDKTCQDNSVPMIGTEIEAEKKKDSVVMVALSPRNNLIPSISSLLLLPRNSQIQVVDLGDGGSSERKSIESDDAAKKTT